MPRTSMKLLDLPPEIIILIAESLGAVDEINRFTQTSRYVYNIAVSVLFAVMDRGKTLRWAARNGRPELISKLLDLGTDIESKDSGGRTALHWAATYSHDAALIERLESGRQILAVLKSDMHTVAYQQDHAAAAKVLLDRGADIEAKSINHTPLHWATACGNVAVVKLLLERKANIEVSGGVVHYTPLILAAINDHERIVRLLLGHGANVEATTMWHESALHWASWAGHEAVALALLKNGASLEDLGSDSQTPLVEAVREGHIGLARILLDHGADINAHNVDGDTPLHLVAEKGFLEIASLLLSRNAKYKVTNTTGCTPIQVAASSGHLPIVDLLLGHDSSIQDMVDSSNQNLLHIAVSGMGTLELIEYLLARGVSTTTVSTNHDATPVRRAHHCKRYELVTAMLAGPLDSLKRPEVIRDAVALDDACNAAREALNSHKIQTDHHRHYLEDALYLACSEGLTDSVRVLIDHGAELCSYRGIHSTPLLSAVSSGNEATVRLLISKGACVNQGIEDRPYWPTRRLQTPLCRAAIRGDVHMAHVLLECGANLQISDERGRSPLHAAIAECEEEEGKEMVRFLMSRGANPFTEDDLGITPWVLSAEGWARKTLVEAGVIGPRRDSLESVQD